MDYFLLDSGLEGFGERLAAGVASRVVLGVHVFVIEVVEDLLHYRLY